MKQLICFQIFKFRSALKGVGGGDFQYTIGRLFSVYMILVLDL